MDISISWDESHKMAILTDGERTVSLKGKYILDKKGNEHSIHIKNINGYSYITSRILKDYFDIEFLITDKLGYCDKEPVMISIDKHVKDVNEITPKSASDIINLFYPKGIKDLSYSMALGRYHVFHIKK